MPRIHVSLPDGPEATHDLTEEVISVGRISDNAIQIEDASVSSHHAEFVLHGTEYALRDIGSTNGTRLNGKPVQADDEHALHHGDEIVFGSVGVRYLSESESDQQPLPAETETGLAPATTTVAPVDFSNASPFPKRSSQRDTAGAAVLALGVLAFLAAGAAIYFAISMQPPSF